MKNMTFSSPINMFQNLHSKINDMIFSAVGLRRKQKKNTLESLKTCVVCSLNILLWKTYIRSSCRVRCFITFIRNYPHQIDRNLQSSKSQQVLHQKQSFWINNLIYLTSLFFMPNFLTGMTVGVGPLNKGYGGKPSFKPSVTPIW